MINIFLITFLFMVALIIGYIIRRQLFKRSKSDILEFILCIATGVIILGILIVIS